MAAASGHGVIGAREIGLALAERGAVPEVLLRGAIRRACRAHARRLAAQPVDRALREFLASARRAPIAPDPAEANLQHYEVPAAFFAAALGPRLKYSSCYWPAGVRTLDAAEDAALEITAERAGLGDGQQILELGCGWGSLSLWMAGRYPSSRIVAVSNSASQRRHIEARAAALERHNLTVLTGDVNDIRFTTRFDRVVSVEMFEHLRNWEAMLRRVAAALAPGGRVFIHHFCHHRMAYAYGSEDPADWMTRHFFTGGMMPSRDYLRRMDTSLAVEAEWAWDGTHYQKTADAWAARLLDRREEAMRALTALHGAALAPRWYQRWRLFFLACAEMFGVDGGSEWGVAHVRLAPRSDLGRGPE